MNDATHPSAREQGILYNVAPDDAAVNGATVTSSTRFIVTARNLPHLDHEEMYDIRDAIVAEALECAHRTGRSNKTATNDVVFDASVIGFVTYDRTAHVAVLDPASISADLLTAIQSMLGTQFPLWRVRFVIDVTDDDIIVYHDVVRITSVDPERDGEQALRQWVKRTIERWEVWRGPQRRQFEWVKNQVVAARKRLEWQLFEVVAVCDNVSGPYESDFSRWMVWTLSYCVATRSIVSVRPEEASVIASYPVAYDDRIGLRGDCDRDVPYRLDGWCIRRCEQPCEFELSVWPDGPSQSVVIVPSVVVTDLFLAGGELSGTTVGDGSRP